MTRPLWFELPHHVYHLNRFGDRHFVFSAYLWSVVHQAGPWADLVTTAANRFQPPAVPRATLALRNWAHGRSFR